MVKIIDVGQTMRTPGLYRVAKDYVIKERSMRILTPVVGRAAWMLEAGDPGYIKEKN